MKKYFIEEVDLSDDNSSHTKLLEMVDAGKRVIDFGCSAGHLSRVLKERGCYVVGIEMDEEAAGLAAEVCDRVIVGDLDRLDLVEVLQGEEFDVGVFGDVIEHLKNPRDVLVQTRGLLAPGGYVVLSVPNIAHASIRLMLLRGEFNYEETGILDDTHLKYYTRESIGDLLESCGYMVDVMDWTDQRISEHELREQLDPLGLSNVPEVIEAFSTWEAVAYQFVVKAFPASEEEQVKRLSEEKVQAERRLRVLEKENAGYEKIAEELKRKEAYASELEERVISIESASKKEMEKIGEYSRMLERKIDEKDEYIVSLENTIKERNHRIEEMEREVRELKEQIDRIRSMTPAEFKRQAKKK